MLTDFFLHSSVCYNNIIGLGENLSTLSHHFLLLVIFHYCFTQVSIALYLSTYHSAKSPVLSVRDLLCSLILNILLKCNYWRATPDYWIPTIYLDPAHKAMAAVKLVAKKTERKERSEQGYPSESLSLHDS